jgi:lambda family phage portal protein
MAQPQTLLDKFVGYISPRWAAERFAYKQAMLSYRGALTTRMGVPYGASTSINGVRQPTLQDQRAMRDRARNLERNNPLAAGVLDRAVENVIGTGIRVEPRTESPEFNEQVKPLWAEFCKSCDIRKMRSFEQIQALLVRSELRDGDVGCLLAEVNGEPKLQPIEGDYLESPAGKYSGGMTVDGVELNGAGAPVGFYVKTLDEKQRTVYQRIAERDFVFLADPNQFSMVRGVTKFAQSFWLFDHIDGYLEGTVTAAKAASYFSLLIKKNNAAKAFGVLGTATNGAGNSQSTLRLEPGTVQYLQPDEDVVQVAPQQPTQNFPDAVAAFARFVGLPFGLTIEQLMLDFSRTNYSSARAARLQAQQTAEMYQARFAHKFISRVYQWWISKLVKRGVLMNAPENYWEHEWIPQGKPWVDPSKEIDAAIKAVKLGVESRSNIAIERGYDFEAMCDRNARDMELLEDRGLPTDPEGASQPQQQPQQPEPDPEEMPEDTKDTEDETDPPNTD